MSEWTLHTGMQHSQTTIHVDWFDENGVKQKTDVDVIMQPQDAPRTLEIRVNGVVVAVIPRQGA